MLKIICVSKLSTCSVFDTANPAELEGNVLEAAASGQTDQVEGYICGALKALKINRLKPDPMLYLSMIGLAKARPELFILRAVTEVSYILLIFHLLNDIYDFSVCFIIF